MQVTLIELLHFSKWKTIGFFVSQYTPSTSLIGLLQKSIENQIFRTHP